MSNELPPGMDNLKHDILTGVCEFMRFYGHRPDQLNISTLYLKSLREQVTFAPDGKLFDMVVIEDNSMPVPMVISSGQSRSQRNWTFKFEQADE